jgi:hypothetical protein
MSYPSRRLLTSTVKQGLNDQPEYVVRFWRVTSPVSAVHGFRILVVGKVSVCDTQPNPSQTDAT